MADQLVRPILFSLCLVSSDIYVTSPKVCCGFPDDSLWISLMNDRYVQSKFRVRGLSRKY